MRHTNGRKLRYQFEQFMARGGSSIFVSLTIVFIISFVLIIGLRLLLVTVFQDSIDPVTQDNRRIWDDIYAIWLQMTDPGNMNQDIYSGPWSKLAAIIAGLVGVILLSALIAFITTAIDKLLYEFRKGRGPVLEEDHTLILGWNERVVDILRELVIANESEDEACVVILSQHDKERMDDFIANRLGDTKTTKIVTSSGDPSNVNELRRVSARHAKSVIVLASCSDMASEDEKLLSDSRVIKTIMALIACQDGENRIPVISEVFTQEKRDIVDFFHDPNLIALDSWDIMGKLLVQTSLTSGLEMVYNEILSFDLSEIYFYEPESWNGVRFGRLAEHFADGIPLGIAARDGQLTLRPGDDVVLQDGDRILILAEDDSTIDFSPAPLYTPTDLDFTLRQLDKTTKKVLILGWHHVGNIFVRESDDYLESGSQFDVMIHEPTDEIRGHIREIDEEFPDIDITLHDQPTISLENLRAMDPFSYDTILILSQNPDEREADRVDSDTLMILLLLRRIASEQGIQDMNEGTKLITQVLDSDNQDLIVQTDVDDFIISNKLITMILAQLSEEPEIKTLYDDIFQEDGSEIYVKPAHLYFTDFPVTHDFATIMGQARKRDEICLGVRYAALSRDSKRNFGVVLNVAKDEDVSLTAEDFLVVLAEDER